MNYLKLDRRAVWLAFALVLPGLFTAARALKEDLNYPLAMCSNTAILGVPRYSEKLVDAGAKMCRIDQSAFPVVRATAEPDPDKWNWKAYESIRRLKPVYPALDWLPILGYSATWAGRQTPAQPQGNVINLPQRGVEAEPAWTPANLYGNYVFESVRRNKDIIHFWESWNEPDLPGFSFFKGNGKDFLPYQRACYLAAKKADPHCVVLFASMTFASAEGYLNAHGLKPPSIAPVASSFFEEYLQACQKDPQAAQNNYYFDVMNHHSYSRATDLYDYVEIDKALMRTYIHQEKPVWITELGFVDQGGMWGGTPDEYCDYELQSFAWAKLAGVQRLFHFQLDDSNGHGLYTGFVKAPKPVLTTYRDVLAQELANSILVGQLHGNKGVGFLQGFSPYSPRPATGYNLFEFRSNDGKRRILMAFSDSSKDVEALVPAKSAQAQLIDRHAQRTQIKAINGCYHVRLPGATNEAGWPIGQSPKAKAMGKPEHLVGGATFLIVEK